jgi:hypothetical protein
LGYKRLSIFEIKTMEIKIGVPIEKELNLLTTPHFKHVIGKTIFDLVLMIA